MLKNDHHSDNYDRFITLTGGMYFSLFTKHYK